MAINTGITGKQVQAMCRAFKTLYFYALYSVHRSLYLKEQKEPKTNKKLQTNKQKKKNPKCLKL